MTLAALGDAAARLFRQMTFPFGLALALDPSGPEGRQALASLSQEQVTALRAKLAQAWKPGLTGAAVLAMVMAAYLAACGMPLFSVLAISAAVAGAYGLVFHSFVFELSCGFRVHSSAVTARAVDRTVHVPEGREHFMEVAAKREVIHLDLDAMHHVAMDAALSRRSRDAYARYLRKLGATTTTNS